jgi:hypothetical protein
MSCGEEKWKNQADVLRTAEEFHSKGGKLVRLQFPTFYEVLSPSLYSLLSESGCERVHVD